MSTDDLRKQETSHYRDILKHWHAKYAGEKPSDDLIITAHALGCRPGIQALSIAMALRDNGYTVKEYFIGTGANATAHNKRNSLEEAGLITVHKEGEPYHYKAVLTDKGAALVLNYLAGLEAQYRVLEAA